MRPDIKRLDAIIDKHVQLQYLHHLPPTFWTELDREWPLILYLHDASARGTDMSDVWESELPLYLQHYPDFPAIVLAPQCPVKHHDWLFYLDALGALLDSPQATRGADHERIVLMGVGMGAAGAVRLAMLRPRAFAAMVFVRSEGEPEMIRTVGHIPAWFFHAVNDEDYPLQNAEALYYAHRNGQLTTYSISKGDEIWPEIVEQSNLMDWMLARRRGDNNTAGLPADILPLKTNYLARRRASDTTADANHGADTEEQV